MSTTPYFLEAEGTVSFSLYCKCRTDHSYPPSRIVDLINVGSTYPCSKHGPQIITRATFRLTSETPSPHIVMQEYYRLHPEEDNQ